MTNHGIANGTVIEGDVFIFLLKKLKAPFVRTFVSKVEIKKVRFFNHILLSYSKVCCAAVLVGWI
jgi:hypothetical protein